MQISYKKLWKLLIDKDMLKKDLAAKADISSTSIAKLSKNENVNTEILRKICTALDCDISDIMEKTQYQKDLTRWANNVFVYKRCPKFEDYEPRKGFKCSEYLKGQDNEKIL